MITFRVLVVDDLESQRTIATHLLQRLNYSVHAVESGEAAVEYLQKNTVFLMILQMVMFALKAGVWCF